jgi:hypothetical protein
MSTNEIDFIRERFDAVDSRMDLLQLEIREMRAHQLSHPPCPAPGSCVPLASRLTELIAKNEVLTVRMTKLEAWQSWITGIGAAAVIFVTIFGPTIRRAFKIE